MTDVRDLRLAGRSRLHPDEDLPEQAGVVLPVGCRAQLPELGDGVEGPRVQVPGDGFAFIQDPGLRIEKFAHQGLLQNHLLAPCRHGPPPAAFEVRVLRKSGRLSRPFVGIVRIVQA